MVKILRHADILIANNAVQLTRAQLTSQRPKLLHGHDFFEVFWVQNGQVRHHLAGKVDLLDEGTIVLVSPGHVHGLQAKGESSFVVSICFGPNVLQHINERHPDLWPKPDEPFTRKLGIRQLATINQSALELENGPQDEISAEAFLMPLLASLRSSFEPKGAPIWLINAMNSANSPTVFQKGARGFVALTGRAHPHVSRTMRKYLGQSPSEFINDIRMKYAANQLLTDQDSVNQIAISCGTPNMAHFHKLFKERFGVTPSQYRQKYRQDVIQPS